MNTRPRKPSVALLMSLMLPGFGQLYNGQVNRAIWLFLVFAFLSVPAMVLVALHLPNGLTVPVLALALLATVGIWVFGAIDAWRAARGDPGRVALPWQSSGLYALVFLLCNGLAIPATVGYVRAHQVESFRIPSSSMAPAILRGDILFADKRYNCPGCRRAVQRGDVAIFVYPNDRTRYYIKRIIALPGDRVSVDGHEVRVNGHSLTVRGPDAAGLITEGEGPRQWQVSWGQLQAEPLAVNVAPGEVFVLGDNRGNATDSRDFGTVPLRDVVGRAKQIWFSSTDAAGVRWQRLGTVVH